MHGITIYIHEPNKKNVLPWKKRNISEPNAKSPLKHNVNTICGKRQKKETAFQEVFLSYKDKRNIGSLPG